MNPPDEKPLSPSEIDALYGLDPVLEPSTGVESTGFVAVHCPYCGERFETTVDTSAGMCSYVEDCQVCCQPIDMELHVDDDGRLLQLLTRRGDA